MSATSEPDENFVLVRRAACCAALFAFAALSLVGGCGDDDSTPRGPDTRDSGFMSPDFGASRDASLPPGSDSSPRADAFDVPDGGSPLPPPPPAMDAGGPPETCGNLAADEPGGRDCEDVDTCGSTPICCADSDRTMCCVGPSAVLPVVDFAACFATGDACLTGFDIAGLPTPSGEELGGGRALWLGGSSDAEGVVLSQVELDPSGSLEAHADVAILPGCEIPGLCSETLAIGFTSGATAADAVSRAVAVVVSLDTAQLLLVDGGVVLARTSFPGTPAMFALSARLSADGRLSAVVDGAERLSVVVGDGRVRALRAVLFGRGGNGSDNHAFVRALDVVSSTCDRPRALLVDDAPVALRQLDSGAAANVVIERVVGAEASDGSRRLVVSVRGVPRAAQEEVDGSLLIDVASDGAIVPPVERNVVLAGLAPPRIGADWRLFVVLDGRDVFSYAGDGATFDAASGVAVTSAAELGVEAIEEPSIVEHGGELVLAFVGRDLDGAAIIETASGREGAMTLESATVTRPEEPSSFDRDGVGSPALVSSRGLLDLYYVGRRGVTESIGLVRRSAPMNPWVRYAASPVLAPRAVSWASIAVGAPSLVLGTGADGIARLDLYFVGFDGANRSLGHASRLVPIAGPGL